MNEPKNALPLLVVFRTDGRKRGLSQFQSKAFLQLCQIRVSLGH